MDDSVAMLQSVDGSPEVNGRRHWMGLLARAALDELEQGIGALPPPAHEWLRRPETGLFMLRGRPSAAQRPSQVLPNRPHSQCGSGAK